MAFETEYRLICDVCAISSEPFDGAIFTRPMVFQELRKVGWVRRRNENEIAMMGRDQCPRCSGLEKKFPL